MKNFKDLQYEDIIQWKVLPLNTVLGVSFTSSTDKSSIQDCKIEKYQKNDISVQTSHKLKIVPLDTKYAKENYYVSDFKSIYNN